MEEAYKQALLELTEAVEKLEPVLEKVKQMKKTLTQEDYIKVLEDENRVLKERVEKQEGGCTCPCPVTMSKPWPEFDIIDTSFSWNSVVIFFVCAWLFLTFLGF